MLWTDLKPFARFKAGQPDYKPAGWFQSWPRHNLSAGTSGRAKT